MSYHLVDHSRDLVVTRRGQEEEDVSEPEINLARLDERLKSLATHEDVASIKVWFLVTAVVLVVGAAMVAAAIAQ